MFVNYAYEIWTVAKVRKVDVGVAFDMFRTDIENGQAMTFNTGDALPDFDFAAVKIEWDALTRDEQTAASTEWHEFSHAMYTEICEAFAEGEDAVIALVEDWRSDHEDN